METFEGFCLDAENAYKENRLEDAIDALENAIALANDDILNADTPAPCQHPLHQGLPFGPDDNPNKEEP